MSAPAIVGTIGRDTHLGVSKDNEQNASESHAAADQSSRHRARPKLHGCRSPRSRDAQATRKRIHPAAGPRVRTGAAADNGPHCEAVALIELVLSIGIAVACCGDLRFLRSVRLLSL